MLFRNIRGLNIQHDEALGLLRVEWVEEKSIAYLRPALVQLHLLAKQLQVRHVLLHLDLLPDLPVFDQIWLGTHWMPTVLQLPLQQVVIALSSARVYNLHAIETLLLAFRVFIKFDVQFFTQSLPGLQWLTNHSPRLPELLAEWQDGFGGSIPDGQDTSLPPPTARLD